MIPTMIDGLGSLAAGVYLSLIGFGAVAPTKDEAKLAKLKRFSLFFKIAGPLITVWGLYNFLRTA